MILLWVVPSPVAASVRLRPFRARRRSRHFPWFAWFRQQPLPRLTLQRSPASQPRARVATNRHLSTGAYQGSRARTSRDEGRHCVVCPWKRTRRPGPRAVRDRGGEVVDWRGDTSESEPGRVGGDARGSDGGWTKCRGTGKRRVRPNRWGLGTYRPEHRQRDQEWSPPPRRHRRCRCV